MLGSLRRQQDVWLAFIVAACGLVPALLHASDLALDCSLAVAIACAVGLRRRWPLLTLSAVLATTVVVTAVHALPANTAGYVLATLVLLYTAGVQLPPAVAWRALVIGLACFWASDAMLDHPPGEYVASAVLVGVPWLGGQMIRRERALRISSQQLAEALQGRQDALALAAVADERRRIAREMHDLVAHGLTAIAVQSNAADAALDVDPQRARAPVHAINALARQCVEEMRLLLTVLRSDEDTVATPYDLASLLAEQPGLGLLLDADVDHAACPGPMRHAVTRIVQEALTNTRRHSASTTARVVVARCGAELRVEISDPGPVRTTPAGPPGHGTTGIKERVTVLGGSCEIGPYGEGWRVYAQLPLARTP